MKPTSWHGNRPAHENHIVVAAWRERDQAQAETTRLRKTADALAEALMVARQGADLGTLEWIDRALAAYRQATETAAVGRNDGKQQPPTP